MSFLIDPPTANDYRAVIHNNCLAGCDGVLWFVEVHAHAIVRQGSERRRGFLVTMTNARRDART